MKKEELVKELRRLYKVLEDEDNPTVILLIKDKIEEIKKLLGSEE